MSTAEYLPHIDIILQALRVNRERLNGKARIAIDARLLRALLQMIVEQTPFSAEFYARTYPDLAEAHLAGLIPDLHRHFVESGYFEGRLGAPPMVDEAFYTGLYGDVAAAVERGELPSGEEHFVRSGAAEGRIPNPDLKPSIDWWNTLLRDDRQPV